MITRIAMENTMMVANVVKDDIPSVTAMDDQGKAKFFGKVNLGLE